MNLSELTAEVTNNSNVSQVKDLNTYLSVMYRKETDKFARVGASIVCSDKVAIVLSLWRLTSPPRRKVQERRLGCC